MEAASKPNRYALLAKLFELVNRLNENQQIMLIKKLHRGGLSSHLFKLMIDLNEEEQTNLLDLLKEMTSKEIPEKTINLDEREAPRKPCNITVDFLVQDQKFTDNILDISTAGVFIETDATLNIGQAMIIRFSFPESENIVEVGGEIVWRSPKGIGVKFYELDKEKEIHIRSFVGGN